MDPARGIEVKSGQRFAVDVEGMFVVHGFTPAEQLILLAVALWLLAGFGSMIAGIVCLFIGVLRPNAPFPRTRRFLARANLITGGVALVFCVAAGLLDPGIVALFTASIIIGGLLGFPNADPTPPTIVDPTASNPKDRSAPPRMSLPRGTGRRKQPRRSGGRPGKQAEGAR